MHDPQTLREIADRWLRLSEEGPETMRLECLMIAAGINDRARQLQAFCEPGRRARS